MRLWGWPGRHGMWQKHSLTISSWWVNQVFIHSKHRPPPLALLTSINSVPLIEDLSAIYHFLLLISYFQFMSYVIYCYIYWFYSQSFPLLFTLKTVRICPHWFSGWLWWISAPLRGVLCPGWIIEAPPRRRRRWPRCDRGDDAAWDQILIPTALKPLGRTILVGHCMIVRNCGSAWNRGLDSLWEISREY